MRDIVDVDATFKIDPKISISAQSPVPNQRTDSLKRRIVANTTPAPADAPSYQFDAVLMTQTSMSLPNSPKIMPTMRHMGSHIPSPKASPMRRANQSSHGSPKRQVSEEQWIDGPRLAKAKVHEARHLMRELNHVKKCETWIDGPKIASPAKSLGAGAAAGTSATQTYGYMDNHKKSMIRQWVENQSSQVFPPGQGAPLKQQAIHITQYRSMQSDEEEICIEATLSEIVNPITACLLEAKSALLSQELPARSRHASEHDRYDVESQRSAVSSLRQVDPQEDEDQDSGPSEVPPALPLIEPLSSREISHDSLHLMCSRHVSRENVGLSVQTIDCGLQVTEEEIARAMGW